MIVEFRKWIFVGLQKKVEVDRWSWKEIPGHFWVGVTVLSGVLKRKKQYV